MKDIEQSYYNLGNLLCSVVLYKGTTFQKNLVLHRFILHELIKSEGYNIPGENNKKISFTIDHFLLAKKNTSLNENLNKFIKCIEYNNEQKTKLFVQSSISLVTKISKVFNVNHNGEIVALVNRFFNSEDSQNVTG